MKIFSNILFYVVIVVLVGYKAPGIFDNFKKQNQPAPVATIKTISGAEITFPIPNQKMIVVFWATWCGPCKIELNRLNDMMANGLIKSNQLLAISVQESAETVNAFLNQNPLQFMVALDESGEASNQYNVTGTPTIVFLDDQGKINWATSGLSPTLEYRVTEFLKK
jgi:thiol-disulfide isomerase/thioredoxin